MSLKMYASYTILSLIHYTISIFYEDHVVLKIMFGVSFLYILNKDNSHCRMDKKE